MNALGAAVVGGVVALTVRELVGLVIRRRRRPGPAPVPISPWDYGAAIAAWRQATTEVVRRRRQVRGLKLYLALAIVVLIGLVVLLLGTP